MYLENFNGDGDMGFNASAIPEQLFGTWKQLSGRYVDLQTGEERPGLSQAPNGYIHFARDGRLFNMAVDSARQKPAGQRASDEEAQALFRTLIAYTARSRSRAIACCLMLTSAGTSPGPEAGRCELSSSPAMI
jgi:hypothetical protein